MTTIISRTQVHHFGLMLFLFAATARSSESRILDLEMTSDIVPSPVNFSVLLPPDYGIGFFTARYGKTR